MLVQDEHQQLTELGRAATNGLGEWMQGWWVQVRDGMSPSRGLSFVQLASLGPVYLVGDEVYLSPARARQGPVVRVGSLAAHAKALADRVCRTPAFGQGLVGQAQECIQQLKVARFCLLDLIPYLQSLQERGMFPPARPLDEHGMLESVTRRATELDACLRQRRTTEPAPSELAKWFGTPCAILGRTVSPLEPIDAATPTDFDVAFAGARYRICLERARPLSEALSELDRSVMLWARTQNPVDSRQTALAIEFVGEIKKILDRYQPVARSSYAVVYADRELQVHHSGGRFLLVRGPVRNRNECRDIWVALELKTGLRPQLLESAPQAALNPGMFWKSAGTPAGGGMCMGPREQYRHLLSNEFTDAEAVVLWLDAGVILATGRSAFHRAWRGQGAEGVANAPVRMMRRRLRRVCL